MGFLTEYIIPHFNFWVYVILMMIGMYAMITKNNLIKKLIGMSIFQTAIILFYVSLGAKEGAKIPILEKDAIPHGAEHGEAHAGGHGGEGEAVGPQITQIMASATADLGEGQEGKEEGGHRGEKGAANAEMGPPVGEGENHGKGLVINADLYANPLPHVLMLTAIVVGVATLGVALAIAQMVYREYGTLEEDEVLQQIKRDEEHV